MNAPHSTVTAPHTHKSVQPERSERHRKLTVLTARTPSSQKGSLSILPQSAILPQAQSTCKVCWCMWGCLREKLHVCVLWGDGFNFPSQRQFVFITHGRSQWSYHLCYDSADGLNFATSPWPKWISMHEVEERVEGERNMKKEISLSLNILTFPL